MNENNQFNQPVGQPNYQYNQPVGQPNNGMPSYTGSKKPSNSTTIIVSVVAFVVAFAVSFFIFSGGSGKSAVGTWECTGTSGNATIKLTKSEVEMTTTTYGTEITLSGKYSKLSNKVTSSSKKDGYSYSQYKLKDAKAKAAGIESNLSNNLGFVFGVSKDGKKGHYIDGSGSSSLQYECTKK